MDIGLRTDGSQVVVDIAMLERGIPFVRGDLPAHIRFALKQAVVVIVPQPGQFQTLFGRVALSHVDLLGRCRRSDANGDENMISPG